MSQDARFARLKTDPRFRKPRKKQTKVVVDQRFKSIFEEGNSSRIDKYGRRVSSSKDTDNLRRFYRLEDGRGYARGEGLIESSDEEEGGSEESDFGGQVTLGRDPGKPITIEDEIDLDESQFPILDAQAAVAVTEERDTKSAAIEPTRRLAVVNLDWDHVRASHLFKIFSSTQSKGKVLNVRVYPSQFGKERMEREEIEGPPSEVFQEAEEVDDDALRKYQLERLRYYYAIVTCDTQQTATYIYEELEGTELERSANVFDLSYVPDDMQFEDDFRDEARENVAASYKPVDFTTDALRHSKVKLTWDEDDPERSKVTRRTLSRKEIEEDDFKAYLATDSEEDEDRDKLRALLLANDDDHLGGEDEMEISFTPALMKTGQEEEETTLEKYQRQQKEKKARKKSKRKDVEPSTRPISTAEELSLILPSDQPQHFDLKKIMKAEKKKDEDGMGDFKINVNDERFKALHQDHTFAIDPSNPHFKKTKSMAALLQERSRRQHSKDQGDQQNASLQHLVDSVKRKSRDDHSLGKRRKL